MIPAYNELYLSRAMHTLGSLFDLAMVQTGIPAPEFEKQFSESPLAARWQSGEPSILCGKSAPELLAELTGQQPVAPESDFDRSPEYWSGYILCYVQWATNRPFSDLFAVIPLTELLRLYPTLHEADISKTLSVYKSRLFPETPLKTWRTKRGLSQSELAKISGIPIRTIRAYEQREADIDHAQYNTLAALAQALSCDVRDLID